MKRVGTQHKLPQFNQHGMSIIQALVLIGVLSAIGAAIATMMLNTSRQAQSVSAKGDFNSLVNVIQANLNNTGGCLKAFGGTGATTLGAFPMTVALDVGATPIAVGPYGAKLKISKLELTGKVAGPLPNQWIVPLDLVVDRSSGGLTAFGGNILKHTFDVLMTVDGTSKVIACSAQSSNYWVSTDITTDVAYLGGNVGIGILKTDSVMDLLDVKGEFKGTLFMYSSDRRLKENIREIPTALAKIRKLRGVMFDWKEQVGQAKRIDQLGFIAQEVEGVFPEAVVTNSVTGMKTVAYDNLIAPFIEAMKEHQNLILSQQKEIDEIKKELLNK